MYFLSTRGKQQKVSPSNAVVKGLSDDGGLFVPEEIPQFTIDDILKLSEKAYSNRATDILSTFFDDFEQNEISGFCDNAYSKLKFFHHDIAPVCALDGKTAVLELWHGPTCAFKDYALQLMPQMLIAALRKTKEKRKVCILVATSGDTGKAALEAFSGVSGTKIMVFYPSSGVSDIQKLQMISQRGDNLSVVAVDGNFDDTQSGVKAAFSDNDLNQRLADKGIFLSSANSINALRLLPQIVYYFSSYCDLVKSGAITDGAKVNFCVPTGNFGNILAGYYAKRMGLPVNKLICSSNRNDVLTSFFGSGEYNVNRPFYTTVSPSMDILVSSNLERLLFELSGRTGGTVSKYMDSLRDSGSYKLSDEAISAMRADFAAGSCSEADTMKSISQNFSKFNYLFDTHTAVAAKVLFDYREQTGDNTYTVIVSTASPFKFPDAVLQALGHNFSGSSPELISKLSDITGADIPVPLRNTERLTPRFFGSIKADEMSRAIAEFLY